MSSSKFHFLHAGNTTHPPGLSGSPSLWREIPNPFTHVSFRHDLKPDACGWHCPVHLPTWDEALSPWTTFAEAFLNWCFLEAQNSSGLSIFFQVGCSAGCSLTQKTPSFYSVLDRAFHFLSFSTSICFNIKFSGVLFLLYSFSFVFFLSHLLFFIIDMYMSDQVITTNCTILTLLLKSVLKSPPPRKLFQHISV